MDKTSIKDSASLPHSLCGWNKHNFVSSAVCWREVPALPFYPPWAAKSNLHNQGFPIPHNVSLKKTRYREAAFRIKLFIIYCMLTIQIWSCLHLDEAITIFKAQQWASFLFCEQWQQTLFLSMQQLSSLLLLCPVLASDSQLPVCACMGVWWKQLYFHMWLFFLCGGFLIVTSVEFINTASFCSVMIRLSIWPQTAATVLSLATSQTHHMSSWCVCAQADSLHY